MKARSVVFTHMQMPATVFGLPPRAVLLSVLAGIIAFLAAMMLGVMWASFLALAAVMAIGLTISYRIGRADRHIETVTLTSITFWWGASRRWLLTGAFPRRSLGGRS